MEARGNRLKTCLDALLGFLYPPICQLCGSESATVDEGYVGGRCRRGVRLIEPPFCARCGLPYEGDIDIDFTCANCRDLDLDFESARSAAVASGVLLEVLHRYKYRRALWFEPFLADLLVRAARPFLAGGGWDLIVPVPLHPVKKREREFNQSERLARRLGKETGLPVRGDLVRRVAMTRTQTLLTREERQRNVRGAFAVRAGEGLRGDRVVVVDDVLTTGATASACAGALRDAGAGRVCVWTVARGL